MSKYQIFGGIAQLVERLNGIQEVAGSIPTISTTIKIHSFLLCIFLFIDVFRTKPLFFNSLYYILPSIFSFCTINSYHIFTLNKREIK